MSSQKDDLEVLLGSTTGVDTTRRSLIGLLAGFHALSLAPSSSTASVAEVGGSGGVETTTTSVFEGTINKSPSDPRSYRALTLANGLNVLLVTDPLAEGAAAALDVHVGHFSDPDELPGLAHFCEHMLFLGTKTFPEEDGFASYLAENGGSSNAFTAAEDTCFFFDLALPLSNKNQSNPLERSEEPFLGKQKGALTQFASFFREPLFTASGAGREINAVDSEHKKNLQQDGWRLGQLTKATRANPLHPNFNFGTGSKETLNGDGLALQKSLRAHWAEFYVANLMTLCVVSPLPAARVQEAVEQVFGALPSASRLQEKGSAATARAGNPVSPPRVDLPDYRPPEAAWRSQGIAPYLIQQQQQQQQQSVGR